MIEAIRRDPHFQTLVARRTRFAWAFTVATLIFFLGYIDILTFAPERLGVSIGGFMTLGILVSLLVIRRRLRAHWPLRAPRQYYDALTRQIIEKVEHRHAMSLKEGEPAPKGSRKISCRGAGKARVFVNFVPGKQSPSYPIFKNAVPGTVKGLRRRLAPRGKRT